jgi:hypothetical protein
MRFSVLFYHCPTLFLFKKKKKKKKKKKEGGRWEIWGGSRESLGQLGQSVDNSRKPAWIGVLGGPEAWDTTGPLLAS